MITAAISGSVMTFVVLVLRTLFLHKLPKWLFRCLWILVAIRFILPFSLALRVEVKVPTYISDTVILSQIPTDADDNYAAEPKSRVDMSDALRAVFLLGTAVSGGFMLNAYIRMRRLALSGDVVKGRVYESGQGVTVRSSESCDAPYSCGVFPPVICIPNKMLSVDAYELDMIIAHEKHHIESGDQLVKWLIAAAFCFNWYNPAAWIMLKVANRDIEIACDEAVVRHFGNSKKYALTLISAAERRAAATVCTFGAPLLDERIKCIMKSKKTTVLGFVAAAVMLTLMTVFFVSINAVEAEKSSDDGNDVFDGIGIESFDERVPEETITVDAHQENDAAATHSEETGEAYCEEAIESVGEIALICPISEYFKISGAYGNQTNPVGVVFFNNGVNVAADAGTAVYAAAGGTVIYAGYDYENGNMVTISHGEDYVTYYSHLEAYDCKEGDKVLAGDRIASVGTTGSVTGANLGFSIMVDGGYIDPTPLFE